MSLSIALNTSSSQVIPPVPKGERRPLLTPLPEPGHFLMVLDNTSLEKWKRCPTAAYYYLVLRREAHARNAALTFGGALHEGLDRFHRQQFWKEQPFACDGMGLGINADFGDAAQDSAISNYFIANPPPLDEYRTVSTALQVMSHYRNRCNPQFFPDYNWEIQSDDKGPIIERAFELPLGVLEVNSWVLLPQIKQYDPQACALAGCDSFTVNAEGKVWVSHIHIAWSGRIDLIAKCQDQIRVVDHKTTSITTDQFVQGFQLASQTLGYVWAARQLWPELDVNGFCLNAIALKKPNVGCVDLMAKGARGGPPPLDFFRNYFTYATPRIDEWVSDTLASIEDFVHCLVRNLFPHNDRHCFDKFGQCPYHSVCTIDEPQTRHNLITSEAFREVTWNPVAKTTQ